MPASLLWLVAAWERPTARGLRTAPAVLALVVALTVAQPFDVIASKEEAPPQPPKDAERGESVHVARVLGIRVLPFRLYNRDKFWPGENTPTETIRARAGFWLPVLTNASEIAETCSTDVQTPCWNPRSGQNLVVFRDGGKQWATIDNPPGSGPGPASIPDSFTWKLSAGIASPAGLAYWALAAVLLITARRRRATTSRPT